MDRELEETERALRAAPRDLPAWVRLARLARRAGRLPGFLDPAFHLPWLRAAWRRVPEERALADLVLPLLGLRPAADPKPEDPGGFWRTSSRWAEAGDHWFDAVTGFPLRVVREADGAELVYVPDGESMRGSWDRGEDGRLRGEEPTELVWVDEMLVDRFPVTRARWARFLAATGRLPDLPADLRGAWEGEVANPRHPVAAWPWAAYEDYAAWAGARLPREVEWEKVARGVDARIHPWGNEIPTPARANFRDVALARAADPEGLRDRLEAAYGLPGHLLAEVLMDVDAHPAGRGPYGAEDLAGNAYELCRDPGEPPAPPDGRWWRESWRRDRRRRVARGGSWGSEPDGLVVTRRVEVSAADMVETYRDVYVGFRLVQDAWPAPAAAPPAAE